MPLHVAGQIVKMLIKSGKQVEWSKVLVLGLTFKENVPDFRNSKISAVIRELKEFGVQIVGYDPYSENLHPHILAELHLEPSEIVTTLGSGYDGVIFSQNHTAFANLDLPSLLNQDGIIFDIKGKYRKSGFQNYKSL